MSKPQQYKRKSPRLAPEHNKGPGSRHKFPTPPQAAICIWRLNIEGQSVKGNSRWYVPDLHPQGHGGKNPTYKKVNKQTSVDCAEKPAIRSDTHRTPWMYRWWTKWWLCGCNSWAAMLCLSCAIHTSLLVHLVYRLQFEVVYRTCVYHATSCCALVHAQGGDFLCIAVASALRQPVTYFLWDFLFSRPMWGGVGLRTSHVMTLAYSSLTTSFNLYINTKNAYLDKLELPWNFKDRVDILSILK